MFDFLKGRKKKMNRKGEGIHLSQLSDSTLRTIQDALNAPGQGDRKDELNTIQKEIDRREQQ
jgi:hypothetical protein